MKLGAQQALRWEKIRARGKIHYILVYGVLRIGGVLLLAITLLHVFIYHELFSWSDFIIRSICYGLSGLLLFFFSWNSNEAAYAYFKSEQELKSLTHG